MTTWRTAPPLNLVPTGEFYKVLDAGNRAMIGMVGERVSTGGCFIIRFKDGETAMFSPGDLERVELEASRGDKSTE